MTITYDYSKLRGRIVEVFGSTKKFAAALGTSNHTISCKLNNKGSWTQPEMIKVSNELGFPVKEIPNYFFNIKVQS